MTTPATGAKTLSGTKKLSVILTSELHLRAKRHALENDQTLTDLIETLLLNHLNAHEGR